ncbi:adenosylcobinamide-GDP ribazoletransferase [Actibacterium sp. 188UL27-1]|uniref:adenosylcobinamide-GDP ribazoletransferase n=1 Tax=Actibacterium sp. 188UL27-1 TaxID=2786961 RepID=UPI00195CC279|nr:adenosylcobinamide-GDP ribazoletransferase [Actibacterium sp. 188UL27-1]MBM7066598.1 adenosylcobinamide-GDP ribazoletransferase [Actibacterium sp. 188UL27-1]
MAKPATLMDLRDIPAALGLLTRLPIPVDPDFAQARGAAAAWAYPLVGLVTAASAWIMAILALWIGLPTMVTAGLVVGISVILTGALHEDGLADTADGLWGGWTPERRLEIMKDSHIGTYGVAALMIALGLRWQVVAALIDGAVLPAALIASAVLSRGAMVAVMATLPHARRGGLSAMVGRPGMPTTLIACTGAAAIAAASAGWGAIFMIPVAILVAAGVARLAMSRIGGQTGDILGAVQILTEVACLITMLAVMA